MDLRKNLFLSFKYEKSFEKFLINSLKYDLPIAFIESFNNIEQQILDFKQKPKYILSGGMIWDNEIYKHWVAKMLNKGSKLICMEHGGSFPYKFNYFFFEENFSSTKITWFKSFHKKQKQLPAQKLLRKNNLNYNVHNNKNCSLIADRFFRYTYSLAQPVSGSYFSATDNICSFYKNLNFETQKCFKIKLHPGDNDKSRRPDHLIWNIKKYIRKKIRKDIISKDENINDVFANSKIVICFYPETTFSESMLSGIPTLLFISKEIYKIHPVSMKLMKSLGESKIIFHDINEMAAHVNKIWNDPMKWWQTSEIKKKRKLFNKIALGIHGENNEKKWKDYILKLNKKNV